MRSLKVSFAASTLVCAFATTAFAQDPAPTDAAEAPADTAAAPAAEPAAAASTTVTTDTASAGGKFVIGARLGYGIAMGDAMKDSAMSDGVSGQIPIWLDLGYMVTPNIMVGLYGQYGFGIVGSKMSDVCDAGNVDCSVSDLRVGVQGQYHLSPSEKLDPWFGLGIGYEWAMTSMSGGGQSQDYTYSGFEFLNLQGGADFKLSPAFGIGPFLSFSLGQFGSVSASGDLEDGDTDIDDKALHEWLTLGVRGSFTL